MKTIIKLVLITVFVSSFSYGQQIFKPFTKQAVVPANLKLSLESKIDQYVLLSVNQLMISDLLKNRPALITIELPVTSESIVHLDMERNDILAPGAQIVEGTTAGDKPFNFDNRFVSYKIRWNGADRHLAVINFSDAYINGLIENSDGEMYELGALNAFGKSAVKDYIIYPISHLKARSTFMCGVDDADVNQDLQNQIEWIKSGKPFDVTSASLLVNQVAVEMDYQAFLFYGSAENAAAYALSLFATSSAIYNRDINTMFNVTYIRVWTTASDPYTDNPASSSTLLNEFRTYWNTNMRHVPRTIAHFATPRNQQLGGLAYVDVLCESIFSGYGYGFSDIQNSSTIPPLPTYSWQVMVITHEIGHNYGSNHTHHCSWNPPIDTCYYGPETQACYSGPCTLNSVCVPRLGTIMSYCHLTSSGTQLIFGPLPSALIRSYAEAASCMIASTNPVKVGYPNGNEQFTTKTSATATSPTTPITWGTSLSEPFNIDFSPDSGLTWQAVTSNVPSGTRQYIWTIPYIQTTDNALIRVASASNPAVSDTSDLPFEIKLKLWSFKNLSPVMNTTIFVDSNDYTPFTFIWNRSGDISDISYKMHLKKRTGTVPTAMFLSNRNGLDTSITVTAHQIDSAITSWSLWSGDSIQCYWYGVAYNDPDSQRVDLRFNITFKKSPSIDIDNRQNALPNDYLLLPCFPNPFNPVTTIRYNIPVNAFVSVSIYNMLGQKVNQLVNSFQSKGLYSVQWDGTNQQGLKVSSGIYFYSLEAGSVKLVRKMTLIK